MHLPIFRDGAFRAKLFFVVCVPRAASRPKLTCYLVHATPAIDEKGNESTGVALKAIVTQFREYLPQILTSNQFKLFFLEMKQKVVIDTVMIRISNVF
jgi:hypothetical protein